LTIKEPEARLTLHEHDDDEVYYLLLILDMPAANQPTIMGEAISHKHFGRAFFI